MDPADPTSFNQRIEKLSNGRTYHFVDETPSGYNNKICTPPTLLCLHGFPDLWYGWRYQIGPWVRKGFRVVAPSMLGYGGTDKPNDASEYTMKKLCADLVALLDYLEISKPVVIGHDWGAFTAGRFALWHPHRLSALVIMSVPYTPPTVEHVSIQDIGKRIPNLRYQAYFSDPKFTPRVEEILPSFLKMVFCVPGSNPGVSFVQVEKWHEIDHEQLNKVPLVLTAKELAYYESEFRRGMHAPLNYYRTDKLRHDEEKAGGLPSNLRADLPVLFLWGTRDPTTVGPVVGKAHKFISRLQDVALEGKGHWIQIEAKDEVSEQVLAWLDCLCISSRATRARL